MPRSVTTTSRTLPTWSPLGSNTATPASRAMNTRDGTPLMGAGYRRSTVSRRERPADALGRPQAHARIGLVAPHRTRWMLNLALPTTPISRSHKGRYISTARDASIPPRS